MTQREQGLNTSKFGSFAWAALCVVVILLAVGAFASRRAGRAESAASSPRVPHVALFINGVLGDKSFYDLAARGVERARSASHLDTRVVEGGSDPIHWEDALTDLADSGDYDVIITGTYTMVPYVQKLAPQYPKTKFIVFDATVNYQVCACRNVYSMLFRQSEGAYLAGVLAARLTQAGIGGLPRTSPLGMIGGMQIPVVEDFLIGFSAGVSAAAPELGVIRQYANSFTDPATGKEFAKAQYAKGVGIIFQAAGGTGQGVTEAALESGRYMIGVDSDQVALYQTSNPQRAAHIVTSVMKNVDNAIVMALQRYIEGTLAFGKSESFGLREHGIGLANNSAVISVAGDALLDELRRLEAAIADGAVKVPSAFDMAPTPKEAVHHG
jgi:basic membrane protein A and related proteins